MTDPKSARESVAESNREAVAAAQAPDTLTETARRRRNARAVNFGLIHAANRPF